MLLHDPVHTDILFQFLALHVQVVVQQQLVASAGPAQLEAAAQGLDVWFGPVLHDGGNYFVLESLYGHTSHFQLFLLVAHLDEAHGTQLLEELLHVVIAGFGELRLNPADLSVEHV